MADVLTNVSAAARESGNAVRLDFVVAADTVRVRVVRRAGADPTSPTDAVAAVVFDGLPSQYSDADPRAWVVDHGFVPDPAAPGSPAPLRPLENGTTYHYACYSNDGAAFSDAVVVTATPTFAVRHEKFDVKRVFQQRLFTTLRELVAAGGLGFKTDITEIPVIASYAKGVKVPFPLVSVVRTSDANAERFTGDYIGGRVGPDGHEELLARSNRVTLKVIGWSQDIDEREALYAALDAALAINTPLFGELGFEDIQVSSSDDQTFDAAPFYFAVFTIVGTVRSTVRRIASDTLTGVTRDGTLSYQRFERSA